MDRLIALGIISLGWALLWRWYFRDAPRDHPAITPEELEILPEYSGTGGKKEPVPWGPLARRMAPVTIVYFCYGWTLWLFSSWIPPFFLHSYHLNLLKSAFFSVRACSPPAFWATICWAGILSDRILARNGTHDLNKARRNLVIVGFLLSAVSMTPVLYFHNLKGAALCLSLAYFFAEFTVGPMWAIPMDIAPRFSGSASGLMNAGSALAAIISPLDCGLGDR